MTLLAQAPGSFGRPSEDATAMDTSSGGPEELPSPRGWQITAFLTTSERQDPKNGATLRYHLGTPNRGGGGEEENSG